jgi:endo-1,4-beta-xylanase
MARTLSDRGRWRLRATRAGWTFIAVALAQVALAAPHAAAATAIPEGSSLWFACTQPAYAGPPSLRCPYPYDPRYAGTFLRGFDRFTPENEFKMMYTEPAENRFDFSLADRVAAFAQAAGKTIRGHTLIWDDELPLWLDRPLLGWNRDWMAGVMRNYISNMVGHFATSFPGVVTEWDVVNEPLASNGTLARSPWFRGLGSDYIPMALELAHQADPSARLLINENGAESWPKAEPLLALATQLKRADIPLDGVGFESHVTPSTAPTLDELLSLWRRYAQAGLNVEVTELDVADDHGVDDPAAKQDVFRRYALACRLAGNCTGFTVWGVADRYSWLGANSDALLYDSNFSPKPMAEQLRQILGDAGGAISRPGRVRARPAVRRRVRARPLARRRAGRSAGSRRLAG